MIYVELAYNAIKSYTEQKKKERYRFGDVTFLSSRWNWIYGIWNIVNSHIPHRVMSSIPRSAKRERAE